MADRRQLHDGVLTEEAGEEGSTGRSAGGYAAQGDAKNTLGMPSFGSDAAAVAMALSLAGKDRCVRIFIAGAVTHVGKTTVCLGILAALRKAGIPSSKLAYIKPATQCEAPDLLEAWCKAEGVENISGERAPLVFYSGFTRSFLKGEQGTSASWIDKIRCTVDELSVGRRVVIVDGVGFPAVGSVVGVDNADVAKACRAPVLVVCKCGVGAAIDSFSLNSSYFVAKGVPVLGAVFNLGEPDGFYSWDKSAESLMLWFEQGARRERFYGVVPKAPELLGLREKVSETSAEQLLKFAELNGSHISTYMDLTSILADAAADPWSRRGSTGGGGLRGGGEGGGEGGQPVLEAELKASTSTTREQVAARAQAAGAKGGG